MKNYENITMIEGGICAPKGFKAAAVNAHIKASSTKNDMAVICCDNLCNAAGIFTQNKAKGAPVIVSQQHLKDGKAQAIIVNSGNANTCNANGMEIAEKSCEITANELGINVDDVLVASTGVIGQKMSIEPFAENIPLIVKQLSYDGSDAAATAIMTTDTKKKEFAAKFVIDGKECAVGAIAKGSGMINPNMATLLSFVTTDAAISSVMLDSALRAVASKTLNMLSVDGDTSTNDTLVILASGLAGNNEITEKNEAYKVFEAALFAVMVNIVKCLARDGEGATKLIECNVIGAADEKTAAAIAKSVISSSLLKAAIFAADCNWGRILCAIGYADADFDIKKIDVDIASKAGKIAVCRAGFGIDFSEDDAYKILSEEDITIIVNLNNGKFEATAWGCDLTYDYVKINAEYRS